MHVYTCIIRFMHDTAKRTAITRSFAKTFGSGSRLRLRKRSLPRANAGGYERYGARVRHSPRAIRGTLLEATAALRPGGYRWTGVLDSGSWPARTGFEERSDSNA